MKRSAWLIAGSLVLAGLLLLFAAGLGLESKSMMGMMAPGQGMMSRSGMPWFMWLWGGFLFFLILSGVAELCVTCYHLIRRSDTECPNCHRSWKKEWDFCPYCGLNRTDLRHDSLENCNSR